MKSFRLATTIMAFLTALTVYGVSADEVTQMLASRKSWQRYTGVEAISSTNDPSEVQQGVQGVLQWAAGPVGLRMGNLSSTADEPFIEMGPRKILTSTGAYRRYPYYSYDKGTSTDPVAFSYPSVPLTAGSYNKYTIYNDSTGWVVRIGKWKASENNYTDYRYINTVPMGISTFDNVVAGGESLCRNVNYGCPVGYVRHTFNSFLEVSNATWYGYCYTSDGGSPLVFNAPSGYRPDGFPFDAGRVSSCGPGPVWDVLYR